MNKRFQVSVQTKNYQTVFLMYDTEKESQREIGLVTLIKTTEK